MPQSRPEWPTMTEATRIDTAHAEDGKTAVIRVSGPCMATSCKTVRAAADSMRQSGAPRICVDLAGAGVPDSTFVGMLLALSRKYRSTEGALTIVSPSPDVRDALERMHVTQLLNIEEHPPVPNPDWRRVDGEQPQRRELADQVVESHETLINADRRNAGVFQRIVDAFRNKSRD
jgi:anti-anti-sigma regulatory factor